MRQPLLRASLLRLSSFVAIAVASVTAVYASPITYDAVTLATTATDPDLVHPWGMSSTPAGPFLIGANGSGQVLAYDGAGDPFPLGTPLAIAIPFGGSVTGVAFNASAGSGSFNGDAFLFASQDGAVSGWRGALGTNAEAFATPLPVNLYTGLDVGSTGGSTYAYIANFHTGAIDVMKGTALAPDLLANFVDPALPAGFAPFNVSILGGVVYVTYALQDGTGGPLLGPGLGIVDEFDLNGNLIRRLATGGALDAPWGLALAPLGFGDLAGALLVGNFGDGHINAYDPISGLLLETLVDSSLSPLTIGGLRALRFGNGVNGGDLGTLYFTADPGGEAVGSFGKLAVSEATTTTGTTTGHVPEPGLTTLLGVGVFGLLRRRRR